MHDIAVFADFHKDQKGVQGGVVPRVLPAEAVKEGGNTPSAERWEAPGGLSSDPGDPVGPKEGLAVRQGTRRILGEEGG